MCLLDSSKSSLVKQVGWWKKGVEGLKQSKCGVEADFVCPEAKLDSALVQTRDDRGLENLRWN